MNDAEPNPDSQSPVKITRRKVVSGKYALAAALMTLLSAAGAVVCLLAPRATPGAQGVELAPIEATVSGESEQEVELTVTNRRGAAINIVGVSASCGCTVLSAPDPRTVPAGGRSRLKARATPPGIGEKRVQIEVYVEGEPKPLVAKLTLKGREPPIPSLNWEPSEVVARGELGSEQVEKFMLLSTEQKGAMPWINGVHCDSSGIKVEIASPSEERGPSAATVRRKYPVSVAVTLEKPGRIRLGAISLELSSPADGSAPRPIPVFSDCRLSVEAAPDTVFASVSPDELPKAIVVRFRAPSMKSPPLELKPDPINVAWLEVDEPRASASSSFFSAELPIRITAIPAEDNSTSRRTTIRLRTNARDCPLLEIPVYVQPKAPAASRLTER